MKITSTKDGQVWEFVAAPGNGFRVTEILWDAVSTTDGAGLMLTDFSWSNEGGFRVEFEHFYPSPRHRQSDFAALLERLTELSA